MRDVPKNSFGQINHGMRRIIKLFLMMIVVLISSNPPLPTNHLLRKKKKFQSEKARKERSYWDTTDWRYVCARWWWWWFMTHGTTTTTTTQHGLALNYRCLEAVILHVLSRAVKRDPQEGGRQAHVRSSQCATLKTYLYTLYI